MLTGHEKAVKEAFDNNMLHYGTMTTTAKDYLSNQECFVQEAKYHILPDLKIIRIFPAVCSVSTNPVEERVQKVTF